MYASVPFIATEIELIAYLSCRQLVGLLVREETSSMNRPTKMPMTHLVLEQVTGGHYDVLAEGQVVGHIMLSTRRQ